MVNVFYFDKINKIGGTEQFLYEIAKKYHKDFDITVLYREADYDQLKKMKKLVRCIKYKEGMKIKCKKAFFNYNITPINDVEAEEYIFISHAHYQVLGYPPPILEKKLTGFLGVSNFASKRLEDYGKDLGKELECVTCYNPLTLEKKEKVIHLVSAGRINDKVKGGERTMRLIDALDRYCAKTGRHYIWTIFTNPTNRIKSISPNVAIMQPRVDVRPYIQDADWCLQLSDDMETYCYTINEALGYGVPIVTTPLSVIKELPITDNERIELNWDCSNVDKVAEEIFTKKVKPFKYVPPQDGWSTILAQGKSTYKEEDEIKYEVEALSTYQNNRTTDRETGRIMKRGERFIVTEDRLNTLLGDNPHHLVFVKVIKEIEKERKENGNTKRYRPTDVMRSS